MRDEFVKLSHSSPDAAYEILCQLGTHLRVDLSCKRGQPSSVMANVGMRANGKQAANTTMSDLDNSTPEETPPVVGSEQHTVKFHEVVAELRNWYIQEPFFQRFPSFKPLYEKSIAIYAGPSRKLNL